MIIYHRVKLWSCASCWSYAIVHGGWAPSSELFGGVGWLPLNLYHTVFTNLLGLLSSIFCRETIWCGSVLKYGVKKIPQNHKKKKNKFQLKIIYNIHRFWCFSNFLLCQRIFPIFNIDSIFIFLFTNINNFKLVRKFSFTNCRVSKVF